MPQNVLQRLLGQEEEIDSEGFRPGERRAYRDALARDRIINSWDEYTGIDARNFMPSAAKEAGFDVDRGPMFERDIDYYGGRYFHTGDIEIDPQEQANYVAAHEVGHFAYYQILDDATRENWDRLYTELRDVENRKVMDRWDEWYKSPAYTEYRESDQLDRPKGEPHLPHLWSAEASEGYARAFQQLGEGREAGVHPMVARFIRAAHFGQKPTDVYEKLDDAFFERHWEEKQERKAEANYTAADRDRYTQIYGEWAKKHNVRTESPMQRLLE